MYITTSTEKRIRYSVTMRTIQYGLVNSAMGQIPCSTERISCYRILLFWLHYTTGCVTRDCDGFATLHSASVCVRHDENT